MPVLRKIDISEAQSRMARRQRTSKHRAFLQEFMDSDLNYAEVTPDDGEKIGTLASGLNSTAKRENTGPNGQALAEPVFPVHAKVYNMTDGSQTLIIRRTDRPDETAVDGDEAEAEGEE